MNVNYLISRATRHPHFAAAGQIIRTSVGGNVDDALLAHLKTMERAILYSVPGEDGKPIQAMGIVTLLGREPHEDDLDDIKVYFCFDRFLTFTPGVWDQTNPERWLHGNLTSEISIEYSVRLVQEATERFNSLSRHAAWVNRALS